MQNDSCIFFICWEYNDANIRKTAGAAASQEVITMSEIKKVVLAYSGGLDTSIIIPWLKEHYNNPEIIAVAGDVGQNDELEGLEEKALKTGASKLYVEDLIDEMVDDVIIPPCRWAPSTSYLLGTAFARPIIGKRLVEIAKKEGADAICHAAPARATIRCGLSWPSSALPLR